MKTQWWKLTWGLWFVLGVLLVAILLTPFASQAATKYWVGGDGNWNDPGHWNPEGQPIGDDLVFLSNSYGCQVTYRNEDYPDAVLASLQINASISGTMTLTQSLNYPLHSQLEIVGINGQGAHIQSNGINNIKHRLFLGYDPGSFGTYDLRSGSLSASEQYIGYKGDGLFLQTESNNTLSSDVVTIDGGLYLGHQPGSIGHYDMYNGQVDALNQYIGYEGRGYFTQHSGVNNIFGTLYLGFESISNGSYELSRDGRINGINQFIGYRGNSNFTQTGGTNVVQVLMLGHNFGSSGTYELKEADFPWKSKLLVEYLSIGPEGTGTFIQSGGTNNVEEILTLGDLTIGKGNYDLSSGSLSAKIQIIGNYGTGIFTQSGGINNITNSLILAANPGSNGTYNLEGGSLTAGTIQINSGGTFNVTGSPSLLTTTVTGDINNASAVKTTNADVTWDGTFTLKGGGVYHSDLATQTFNDLVVEPTGYVMAASRDTFVIKNDFQNESTRNTDWNTRDAVLQFVQGDDDSHDFYLPGADLGPNWSGYDDNFAWGTLNIDGQTVRLFDGNGDDGGALYVGEILGVQRDLDTLTVMNIIGQDGINLYYNPFLEGNDYLFGKTFALNSTGTSSLRPTPVPGSVLLLGTGLLGLGLLGWRRKRG